MFKQFIKTEEILHYNKISISILHIIVSLIYKLSIICKYYVEKEKR